MGKIISKEKKAEAVRMVLEGGLSSKAVAQQLGMGQSTIEKALMAYREEHGEELTLSEREELKKLRRECAELRMEREILKKAAAYFAKTHA